MTSGHSLQTPPRKRRSFRALNLAHPHRISARMLKLSFLDLVPVTDSGTIAQSLANAADLARHAEALGYHRYWVAEHHGMAGIASAATAVGLAHIGHATRSEEHTSELQSLMRIPSAVLLL